MSRVAILAAFGLALSASGALAVSEVVKQACSSDYAAYCSDHKVGTEALRTCMRAHRHMLSASCLQALGSSDEVTQDDIQQYKRESRKE